MIAKLTNVNCGSLRTQLGMTVDEGLKVEAQEVMHLHYIGTLFAVELM